MSKLVPVIKEIARIDGFANDTTFGTVSTRKAVPKPMQNLTHRVAVRGVIAHEIKWRRKHGLPT